MSLSFLRRHRAILVSIGGLFCFYVFIVGAYHQHYRDRILPGVHLGTIDIGNATKTDVLQKSEQERQTLANQQKPLVLIGPTNTSLSVSTKNVSFVDGERLWERAYQQGRSPQSPWTYAPFLLRVAPKTISIQEAIQLNERALQTEVAASIERAGWAQAGQPASFSFYQTENSPGMTVRVEPAQEQRSVDLATTMQRIVQSLRSSHPSSVQVAFITQQPDSPSAESLQTLLPTASRWVSGPVTLHTDLRDEVIPATSIANLIEIRASSTNDTIIEVHLNPEKAQTLFQTLPSVRLQEPKNGTLVVNASNTVVSLATPTRGQRLDQEKTRLSLEQALDRRDRTATATIETAYASFDGPDAERLGIKDFLGQGQSNYSGSPSNRRKNIALGGNHVHQSLVAPGTEFSLLKTLGPIDGENGWLPELVIKGNKTTPEYGGGLCQIGTTVFRAALNSGLPITERRNHSYRVRYYEPAGTDATIYDPAPDFKFKNDTPNWILITQERAGDDIRFLVWGTKDGRMASSSTPVVTNIVPPPPKKIIETTEIPVGTTKCTEVAHAGATASFDYEVTYASGETKKTTFRSVYKPWQAVCLVGVSQVTPAPEPGVDASGLNSAG